MWTAVFATESLFKLSKHSIFWVLVIGLMGTACTSGKREKPEKLKELYKQENRALGDIEHDSFGEGESYGLEDDDYQYENGIYCATVDYYNPNTGTSSSYIVNVEIESDELITVFWPNGGWLDESHFYPEDISSGTCNFISDKGYDYMVTIIGNNCQFTDNDIYPETDEEEDFWDDLEDLDLDEFLDTDD